MLWIALHFPSLSLEVFSRGMADPFPLAVFERQRNRTRVVACNEAALACGVRSGMAASAAQALATSLVVRVRDEAAERESLDGIAAWAAQFTPAVSPLPPDGLLLEVESCLRLHRGLNYLLRLIRAGLDEIGYVSNLSVAPTPHAAWLLSLAGNEVVISSPERLEGELELLPVKLLDQPQEIVAGLEMIGAYTLGDCMRLPRAGMVRRFGSALLDELDRALGRQPDPRVFYNPPPSFASKLQLPAQVNEAEGLLFAARRLLPEMQGYLSLRQAGIQEFELVCCHEDVVDTVIRLGFVKPTRALDRMVLLLRETLARTQLRASVHSIVLKATHILPLSGVNADLFDKGNEAEDPVLLERLRIRLGKEAVFGVIPAADHRPERAWKRCQAGEGSGNSAKLRRPLWLLPDPVRCEQSRLVLQSGPERIASGWWDGQDVARDYYVARNLGGSRLWVYYEPGSNAWFVHGLFA